MKIEPIKRVDILDFEKERGVEFVIQELFDGWVAFVGGETVLNKYINNDLIKADTKESAIEELCRRISGVYVTDDSGDFLYRIPYLVFKQNEVME